MKRQVGCAAMVLSTVAWLLIFGLPFVELETETKLAVGAALRSELCTVFSEWCASRPRSD